MTQDLPEAIGPKTMANATRCDGDDTTAWAGRIEHHGGGYTFMVWIQAGQWFAAFPDYDAAARVGTHTYPDYIAEKLGMRLPDAIVASAIINTIQQHHEERSRT